MPYYQDLLSYLGSEFLAKYGKTVDGGMDTEHTQLDIPFFTEYRRKDLVYRAHPLYRSDKSYYDWAYVKWCTGLNSSTGEEEFLSTIGHILVFFVHPETKESMAIVHSCQWGTSQSHGVFAKFWNLETIWNGASPLLHMVPVDCLEEHACMIPYSDTDQFKWVHIWHPSKWATCFLSLAND